MFNGRAVRALACIILSLLSVFGSAFHASAFEGSGGGQIIVKPTAQLKVELVYYRIGPPSGQKLDSVVNATMTSNNSTSLYVYVSLTISDPQGGKVFDSAQYTLLTNSTITQVQFATTLPLLIPGYYTFLASVYRSDPTTVYDTTNWLYAFLVPGKTVSQSDLGAVPPNSFHTLSPNISAKQFQSIIFTLTAPSPLQYLNFTLGASVGSRYSATLNGTDATATTQLRFDANSASWIIHNVPASPYDLVLTTLTQDTLLTSVQFQAGPAIQTTSLSILSVDQTAQSATPGGSVNFHVVVRWDAVISDDLDVTAEFSGGRTLETVGLQTLLGNQTEVYLTLQAPATLGRYTASITARLRTLGVTTSTQAAFVVKLNGFNITVEDKVDYYKVSRSWIFWSTTDHYDNPSSLSALDVKDVRITGVSEADARGQPTKVNIAFTAHNKLTPEILPLFSLGEGVHYEVKIQFGTHLPIPLGAVIAGDTDEMYAMNIPVLAGKLQFKIIYSIWWIGELVELFAGALDTLIEYFTSGLASRVVSLVKDLGRLSVLYCLKAIIFKGNLSDQDVLDILGDFVRDKAHIDDFLRLYHEAKDVNGISLLSLWAGLVNLVFEKKIDLAWMLGKTVRLVTFIFLHTRLDEVLGKAIQKAFQKFGVDVGPVSVTKADSKKLLDNFGVALSIVELLVTVGRLLTAPLEEGKILGTTVSQSPAIRLDPIAEVTYSGPLKDTSLRFLTPLEIRGKTNSTAGQITIRVDQNVTSFFLVPLSDPMFRHELFSDFGLNATSSDLDWKVTQNQFLLSASGQPFRGIHATEFSTNRTWVQGLQSNSFDADSLGENRFIINQTLSYALGMNLAYTVKVQLPSDSTDIIVLTPNYQVSGTEVTWTTPVDRIVILFSVERSNPGKPCAFADITCSLALQVTTLGAIAAGLGFTIFSLRRRLIRKKEESTLPAITTIGI